MFYVEVVFCWLGSYAFLRMACFAGDLWGCDVLWASLSELVMFLLVGIHLIECLILVGNVIRTIVIRVK